MLRNELNELSETIATGRLVTVMSEITIITASVKKTLLDIAKQANALGNGLKNASPGDKATTNNSIQYLLDISEALNKTVEYIDKANIDASEDFDEKDSSH